MSPGEVSLGSALSTTQETPRASRTTQETSYSHKRGDTGQSCGWSGYAPLPWGIKEGCSYGSRLSSVVGWLGYGGNLTWRKQEYFVEYILGVPISQGSLAKMHRWFTLKFGAL